MTASTNPSTQWLDSVRTWLVTNCEDPADGHRASDAWSAHNNYTAPVVTLLGAYDSAKSALLRRLLVDAGHQCPEWLTISARHETFQVTPVEVDGVLIRDTPGLAPNADDPRGLENSALAVEAAHLTDVLVLVMPPQLATGELDSLRQFADEGWPPGSLMCVITRFDEAGVDPAGDPEGYQVRAEAKVRELRTALHLTDAVAVHVVAPDAYQIAGEDRQPDPAVWNHFREWDGIARLRETLSSLTSPAPEFRTAAGLRYFTHELQKTITDLDARLLQTQSALRAATQNAERQRRALDRLQELKQSAHLRLEGELATLLDLALHAGVDDPGQLGTQTASFLDQWMDQCELDLKRLMQDLEAEFERQMSRPAWQDLTLQLESLRQGSTGDSDEEFSRGSNGSLTSRLRTVNVSLAKSLQDVRQVWAKRTSDFSPKSAARPTRNATTLAPGGQGKAARLVDAGEVFVALAPTLFEIQALVSDLRRERAQENAQRDTLQRIEQRLGQLRKQVGEAAFNAFSEYANEAQAVISTSSDAMEELVASLEEREAMLASAHTQAQHLLGTRPGL